MNQRSYAPCKNGCYCVDKEAMGKAKLEFERVKKMYGSSNEY